MKKPPTLLRRFTRTTLFTVAAGLGLLTACQSRFIYFPNPYPSAEPAAFTDGGGQRLEFTTSQGRQTAWLRLPQETGATPEKVWIMTAGNGSLALDLSDLPSQSRLEKDAFVFLDYPGYGECQGKPSPGHIRDSLRALGPLIVERCHLPAGALAAQGIVWGHSLGAGVALMAAEEYGIRRAVLLSPFTSTMDMTKQMFGFSLGWLVTHRFDNRAGLASLLSRGGKAWIFHGTDDEVIPVTMGRALAQQGGDAVTYQEIPKGRHNTLLQDALPAIVKAMAAARE